MIIGTRFAYCLSDIMLGEVDVNEVYVITIDNEFNLLNSTDSLTHWWDRQMDPMTSHWSQGKNSLHLFDFEECYMKIQTMAEDGKLAFRQDTLPSKLSDIMHQNKGAHWFELAPKQSHTEPAVKLAYDHYVMLTGLCK